MSLAAAPRTRLALDAEPVGPLAMGLRLQSIDLLRGLVIMLMALDHTRDFFHAGALFHEPTELAHTNPVLFATRIVTHLCAPSFVMLAGVSAFLRGARDGDRKSLSWFLLSRGAWLVFLELTVIGFGWDFVFGAPFLQVIWAIGVGMMLLAALCWLPARVVLAIGVAIVAGHNLLDPLRASQFGQAAAVWQLVHEPGMFKVAGWDVLAVYPVLPWFGIMALGYGLGHIFLEPEDRRRRALFGLGVLMILAFVALRALNHYGDPAPWAVQDTIAKTVMSFLNVTKYPPSLLYDLMTLGPAFVLLAAFERLRGPAATVLMTYGRVPLFAYVLHVYLLHGAAMLVGVAQGYRAGAFLQTVTRTTWSAGASPCPSSI